MPTSRIQVHNAYFGAPQFSSGLHMFFINMEPLDVRRGIPYGEPMIIDAHIHIFTPAIIANVCKHRQLVADLHLEAQAATQRLTPDALDRAMDMAGVELALHLPTANAAGVAKVNDRALALASDHPQIATAGTLHPEGKGIRDQLARLRTCGVRAIKLSSFSQGFELDGPQALAMFEKINAHNTNCLGPFFVVLDTYYTASRYFGSDPEHTTTSKRLDALVRQFPSICFVGAHMGGLCAPQNEVLDYLSPSPTLYLDTSNAAHTLPGDVFIRLLKRHGPEHILFGTDWPWFHPKTEIPLIEDLLKKAGFSKTQRNRVFGENAAGLLGL
jgi:predicted TIM-barrel fold metal-dependent hydrolase